MILARSTLEWGMCVFSAWLFLTWKLIVGHIIITFSVMVCYCTKKSDMLCVDVGSALNILNTNRESDMRLLSTDKWLLP